MSKAVSKATDLLREQILAERWQQGEKLGEAELAQILGVSRTPVREALTRLAGEGLVTLAPNRGARVATWSSQQVDEIFDLRLLLEPAACAAAITQLSKSEIDELEALARDMQRMGAPGTDRDFVKMAELNRQFHSKLIQASGSTQLLTTLTSVTHISIAVQNYNYYSEEALARSLAHHHEIVAALREGQPDWVESVVRCHLYNARTAMHHRTQGRIPHAAEH
ncbi:DNA-binding GntR family transcriptional regulator [Rhodococcus rhodochrous J45]|uniref:DNA-binding GntR family transcriptional regulator n=1 Tax=Rhodococcus rhodochrous J45 TaxID=935266 RepID=A0A562E2R8_RHORH|nr:GntR family transcriptional regulator [Rhodococcus rhodochrous]TWH16067.1 DNA-binding GntR family transcriptional regulator [Rhodococcus rhodochrous J45]